MRANVIVRAAWDPEASVWFVEESDVQGLVAEAESLDELRGKILVRIEDLLADHPDRPEQVMVDLIALAHDRLTLSRAAA